MNSRTLAAAVSFGILLAIPGCGMSPSREVPIVADPGPTAATQPRQAALTDRQILELEPAQAYAAIFDIWSKGDQKRTESLLVPVVALHPRDQRVAFFQALCERSRFDLPAADPLLVKTGLMNRTSPESLCCLSLAAIDVRPPLEKLAALGNLYDLAAQQTSDPLIQWAAAIACRQINKPEQSVSYYRHLMKLIDVGSSLVHQTFANVLDDTGKSEEAIAHRLIVIQQEPAGWSYQGYGNTLRKLHRYEDASAAFETATRLSPNSSTFWMQWGYTMQEAGHYSKGIEKSLVALRLNPGNVLALRCIAECFDKNGQTQDAVGVYTKLLSAVPHYFEVYPEAAAAMRKLGQTSEADALMQKLDALKQPAQAKPPVEAETSKSAMVG